MKPMDIIQQFRLDTSSEEIDFLIAADCAEEHGMQLFADFLRSSWDWLCAPKTTDESEYKSYPFWSGYGQIELLSPYGQGGAGDGYGCVLQTDLIEPSGCFGTGIGYGASPLYYGDSYFMGYGDQDRPVNVMRSTGQSLQFLGVNEPDWGSGFGCGITFPPNGRQGDPPIQLAFGNNLPDGSGSGGSGD